MKNLEYKDCLTNELLHKRFKSQFDLVRYAIKLATQKIETHEDSLYPDVEPENIPSEVLTEIAEGYDHLEPEEEEMEEEVMEEEVEAPKTKTKKKVKV